MGKSFAIYLYSCFVKWAKSSPPNSVYATEFARLQKSGINFQLAEEIKQFHKQKQESQQQQQQQQPQKPPPQQDNSLAQDSQIKKNSSQGQQQQQQKAVQLTPAPPSHRTPEGGQELQPIIKKIQKLNNDVNATIGNKNAIRAISYDKAAQYLGVLEDVMNIEETNDKQENDYREAIMEFVQSMSEHFSNFHESKLSYDQFVANIHEDMQNYEGLGLDPADAQQRQQAAAPQPLEKKPVQNVSSIVQKPPPQQQQDDPIAGPKPKKQVVEESKNAAEIQPQPTAVKASATASTASNIYQAGQSTNQPQTQQQAVLAKSQQKQDQKVVEPQPLPQKENNNVQSPYPSNQGVGTSQIAQQQQKADVQKAAQPIAVESQQSQIVQQQSQIPQQQSQIVQQQSQIVQQQAPTSTTINSAAQANPTSTTETKNLQNTQSIPQTNVKSSQNPVIALKQTGQNQQNPVLAQSGLAAANELSKAQSQGQLGVSKANLQDTQQKFAQPVNTNIAVDQPKAAPANTQNQSYGYPTVQINKNQQDQAAGNSASVQKPPLPQNEKPGANGIKFQPDTDNRNGTFMQSKTNNQQPFASALQLNQANSNFFSIIGDANEHKAEQKKFKNQELRQSSVQRNANASVQLDESQLKDARFGQNSVVNRSFHSQSGFAVVQKSKPNNNLAEAQAQIERANQEKEQLRSELERVKRERDLHQRAHFETKQEQQKHLVENSQLRSTLQNLNNNNQQQVYEDELNKHRQNIQELQQQVSQHQKNLAETSQIHQTELQKHKIEVDGIQQTHRQKYEALQAEHQRQIDTLLVEHEQKMHALRSELTENTPAQLLTAQLNEAQKKNNHIQTQLTQQASQIEALQRDKAALEQKLANTQADLDAKHQQLGDQDRILQSSEYKALAIDREKYRQENEQLRKQNQEVLAQIEILKNKRSELENQVQQLKEQLRQAQADAEQLQEDYSQLASRQGENQADFQERLRAIENKHSAEKAALLIGHSTEKDNLLRTHVAEKEALQKNHSAEKQMLVKNHTNEKEELKSNLENQKSQIEDDLARESNGRQSLQKELDEAYQHINRLKRELEQTKQAHDFQQMTKQIQEVELRNTQLQQKLALLSSSAGGVVQPSPLLNVANASPSKKQIFQLVKPDQKQLVPHDEPEPFPTTPERVHASVASVASGRAALPSLPSEHNLLQQLQTPVLNNTNGKKAMRLSDLLTIQKQGALTQGRSSAQQHFSNTQSSAPPNEMLDHAGVSMESWNNHAPVARREVVDIRKIDPVQADLLYPFSDPQQYFEQRGKKAPKGDIIDFNYELFDGQIPQDGPSLLRFKRSCVKNKQQILQNQHLQVGMTFDVRINQQQCQVLISLYFKNITSNALIQGLNVQVYLFTYQKHSAVNIWQNPSSLGSQLSAGAQAKQDVLIGIMNIPYGLVLADIEYRVGNQTIKERVTLPSTLNRYLEAHKLTLLDFKQAWKVSNHNIQRSAEFELDTGIAATAYDFLQVFPHLIEVNEAKARDHALGISEQRFGGYFFLRNTGTVILVKVIVYPDKKAVLQLCHVPEEDAAATNNYNNGNSNRAAPLPDDDQADGDELHRRTTEFLLQTLVMIFSKF